jgi:hypothetical protein
MAYVPTNPLSTYIANRDVAILFTARLLDRRPIRPEAFDLQAVKALPIFGPWRLYNAEVSAIFDSITGASRLLVQPFLQRCPFGGLLGHERLDALGQQRVGICRSSVRGGLGEV